MVLVMVSDDTSEESTESLGLLVCWLEQRVLHNAGQIQALLKLEECPNKASTFPGTIVHRLDSGRCRLLPHNSIGDFCRYDRNIHDLSWR